MSFETAEVANVPLPPPSVVSFFEPTDDNTSSSKHGLVDSTAAPKAKRGRKSKVTEEKDGALDAAAAADPSMGEVNTLADEKDTGSVIDLAAQPSFTKAQAHRICQDHDFFMVFHNSTPFKDMVELIHPVLENINFKVVDRTTKSGQRFRGIIVNSMDSKKVSMIVARLRADDVFPDTFPDQDFCVSSENFSNLIKTIKKGCCLEVKREKNHNSIKIRGFNPNRKNRESCISIPTLDKAEEAPQLNMIDYKFIVDIDLQALRNLTRVAQNSSINAQNINFKISEGKTESGEYQITKVHVSTDGGPDTPTLTETFRSMTKWDRQNAEQTVITTDANSEETDIDDDARLKLVLDEKFSTKYLHLFLKSMDRQTITLRMSPDRPLVIVYSLDGGDNIGYCNFILAPTVKTDE